jgi:site-specific DNA recombinase
MSPIQSADGASVRPGRLPNQGSPTWAGLARLGFQDDETTHHQNEAAVIRNLAARALAGETLVSMATWLQDNDVQTVGGKEWGTNTFRTLLTNPRNWGMRVHQGNVVEPVAWKPIISADQGELLVCGKCGTKLNSAPRGEIRRYGCRQGPDSRGCGGIYIYAEMVEKFIAQAVLYRLDSSLTHEALAGGGGDDQDEARSVADAIQADISKLDELAATWADNDLSRAEWLKARKRVEERLEANRKRFARLTRRDAVADHIGHGDELRAQCDGLNLSRQVAIVKAVLNHVTVLPAERVGRHGLDPNRVIPGWRQ